MQIFFLFHKIELENFLGQNWWQFALGPHVHCRRQFALLHSPRTPVSKSVVMVTFQPNWWVERHNHPGPLGLTLSQNCTILESRWRPNLSVNLQLFSFEQLVSVRGCLVVSSPGFTDGCRSVTVAFLARHTGQSAVFFLHGDVFMWTGCFSCQKTVEFPLRVTSPGGDTRRRLPWPQEKMPKMGRSKIFWEFGPNCLIWGSVFPRSTNSGWTPVPCTCSLWGKVMWLTFFWHNTWTIRSRKQSCQKLSHGQLNTSFLNTYLNHLFQLTDVKKSDGFRIATKVDFVNK